MKYVNVISGKTVAETTLDIRMTVWTLPFGHFKFHKKRFEPLCKAYPKMYTVIRQILTRRQNIHNNNR